MTKIVEMTKSAPIEGQIKSLTKQFSEAIQSAPENEIKYLLVEYLTLLFPDIWVSWVVQDNRIHFSEYNEEEEKDAE